MKKLLFVFFALATMQLSAQSLNQLKATAASSVDTSSMVNQLAADQVKVLGKKLNLSEAQSKQVSDLVVQQLNSPKMQDMLAKYGPEKLMGSGGTSAVTGLLMKNGGFTNGMVDILDEDQMGTMKSMYKKMQ
ncbi:hypothetical protein [Aureitalea marina]|uniref:DUF4197 domain-containing protein n=1 Tax=Aureitalea marina TaxID=930804 RepID=A0A2S7KRQ6_9FLAO|nr:hypothetical protein [Aureitalea marina]PQB05268.1 hypothetical protein BST85_10505 [Aureitalea marina]